MHLLNFCSLFDVLTWRTKVIVQMHMNVLCEMLENTVACQYLTNDLEYSKYFEFWL